MDLGPGRGVPFETLGFADGSVDLRAFDGLVAVLGLDVSSGEIGAEGDLRLALDAGEVRLLGTRVLSDPSISYDSRDGLRIAFGPMVLGPLRLGSGELGPGRQARLLDGRLGYRGLELGFRELLLEPGGGWRILDPRPATLKGLIEGAVTPLIESVRGAVRAGAGAAPAQAAPEPVAQEPVAAPETEAPLGAGMPTERPETLPSGGREPRRLRWPGLRRRTEGEPAPTEEEARIHTVVRGETLGSIAARYYGDSGRYREIAAANGILPPYAIEVGQPLVIPGETAEVPAPAGAATAEPAPARQGRGLLRGLRLPRVRGLFRRRRAEAAQPGTPRLEAFRLGGGVGATARRIVGQDAKGRAIRKTIVPANAPVDVKLVQDFLVATGYLPAEHPERLMVDRALERAPEAGIPEASLGGTVAAIVEWQRLGATGKGYTADGLIAGNEDRAATHARILTDVRNKYASEPPLPEPKTVLTPDKWHSQARYGFNFGEGQETLEKQYVAYVREITGIEDPAELPRRFREAP